MSKQPRRNRYTQANTPPVPTTAAIPAAQPVQVSSPSAPLRTAACYLTVLVIAMFCFVARLAEPPYLFWDENYHVTSAERYIEGIAQFEPHPPLGLMLVAAGEALIDPNKQIDKHVLVQTKQISGDDLPKGFSFAGMRLAPSIFAALGALLFFGLMLELVGNRLHALLLTSLYVFENAFVVHFRAVHLDSFQMFFSLAALWQFVVLWKRPSRLCWHHYALLATWCGLAIMTKINAVLLMTMFPILFFRDMKQSKICASTEWIKQFLSKSSAAAITLLSIVFAVFYVHASIARIPPSANTPAGQQDLGNMSAEYRNFLENHGALTPSMVATITLDYFRFMNKDHKGVPKLDTTKPGENGSHPLHWPLNDKTINYRWDSVDGQTRYVQLTGNQVSWYLGLLAVLLSFQLISQHRIFGEPLRGDRRIYHLIEVFTGLYAVFMLLHLWIITQRVMYLYHYFLGLLLSFILIVLMWQYLCSVRPGMARHRTATLTATALMITASYLFFLPLSNHRPLTQEQCEQRNVIARVVECVQ